MSTDNIEHRVDIPVTLCETNNSIIELLQKFNTEEEKPFIVLKEDKTLKNSKKLSEGQILVLDKMFNNSNLEHIARSLDAIPIYSKNKWGGKTMYSWFSDVADAIIANIANAEGRGGWHADDQKVENISTLLNEMKNYVPWCRITSDKYFPSDYKRFPTVLISGSVCDPKNISADGDARTIFYGKGPYSFTVDMEIKLRTPENTIARIEASRRIYTEIALQDLDNTERGDIVIFLNALDNYTQKKGIRLNTSEDVLLNTLEAAKQNKSLVFSLYDHNHTGKNLNESLEYFVDIMQGITKGLARVSEGHLRSYCEKNVEKDLIEHFAKK